MTEPRLIEMVREKLGEMYAVDFDDADKIIKATATVIREWALLHAVELEFLELDPLLALLTTED